MWFTYIFHSCRLRILYPPRPREWSILRDLFYKHERSVIFEGCFHAFWCLEAWITKSKSMLKSILLYIDILTWLLMEYRLCCQTFRSQVWIPLLTNMDFSTGIFSNSSPLRLSSTKSPGAWRLLDRWTILLWFFWQRTSLSVLLSDGYVVYS